MFFKSKTVKSLVAAAALMAMQSPFAADNQLIDAVSTEFAAGERIHMVRIGVQSNWGRRWFQSNGTHLSGYWDASLGAWRGDQYRDIPGAKQNITDIGFTPVFRFQRDDKKGFYHEVGIGVHRLSEPVDNNGRRLSTRFQFGDHIGAGYVFENKWELGIKFQHFSNGGYKAPNDGVNFVEVKAAYNF